MRKLEVLFSPAEFEALRGRDLSQTTCVVFDILRATSTIVTTLANGATAVIPVATIPEALEHKAARPEVLLAGEREGFRITAELTGSIDFDLGNSPREFTEDRVAGRTIVMTTTNGTRALKACAAAREVLTGSFLNLKAVAERILANPDGDLLLVCSGTHEEASFEDTLAAGALADLIWSHFALEHVADSAQIARGIYKREEKDLGAAMSQARNGRRLLGIRELREDVAYCLRRDVLELNAQLRPDGSLRAISAGRAGARYK